MDGTVSKKEGQVETQLDRLRTAITENEGVINALEDRLSVILLVEPPEKAGEASVPEEALCDLADAIRRSRKEIVHRTGRLSRIIQRIEL